MVIAISTDNQSLLKFIEATKKIKEMYPDIHITSVLSNISYGMPLRKVINQNFLALAMGAGMDSAIMNPSNRDTMATLLAAEMLLGKDRHCRNFTMAFRKGKIGSQKG